MTLAVYPGTFDPFTLGHLDITERALRLFDRLVITVAVHTDKPTLLSSEVRIDLIEQATAHLDNVHVTGFEGLIAEHAHNLGARALVRGLRTPRDFDYESQMAHMNRRMVPELDTVFFHTSGAHALTSSSLVRDILRWNGDIRPFVPTMIAEALMKK